MGLSIAAGHFCKFAITELWLRRQTDEKLCDEVYSVKGLDPHSHMEKVST